MITIDDNSVPSIAAPYIPTGWKLWALLFRSISSGHYQDLHTKDTGSYSFESAVNSLFKETCCTAKRAFPASLRDLPLEDRHTVLDAIETIAQEILDYYKKAEPKLPDGCKELKYFDKVRKNCELIVTISNNWKIYDLEHDFSTTRYFGIERLKAWYDAVNGKCIESIDFSTFSTVLTSYDLSFDFDEGEWIDYENMSITPLKEFGMAMYAFILRMVAYRHPDDDVPLFYPNGDAFIPSPWEEHFQSRIDWQANNYFLTEDSWKKAYRSDREIPSSPKKREEAASLYSLCGRNVFGEIFSEDNLETIVYDEDPPEVNYEQYEYLHENADRCDELYDLLLQETEYLYRIINDIVLYFKSEFEAIEFRKWDSWMRAECNELIKNTYSSLKHSPSDIKKLLSKRASAPYGYLDEQPILSSALVRDYLKRCVVQDERLILVVKSNSNRTKKQEDKSRPEVFDKQIQEAISGLQKVGIIDSECRIQKLKSKNDKTIQLANYLVRHEYVVPRDGWERHLSYIKLDVMASKYLDSTNDRHIPESYYDYDGPERKGLKNDLRMIVRKLNWAPFDEIFIRDGERVTKDFIRDKFNDNNPARIEIFRTLLKKYDQPMPKG